MISVTIVMFFNLVPAKIVSAQAVPGGLVSCGFDLDGDGKVKNVYDSNGNLTRKEECGFTDLILLVKRVTDFLIILATAVATLSFAWAGILYITAVGDEGKIKQAHEIFKKVLIGFVFILSAWLIVVLIQTALIPENKRSGDDGFQTLEELNI
ncbi:MAG: pilin [bacterium]|nr:pilin [bacterium]